MGRASTEADQLEKSMKVTSYLTGVPLMWHGRTTIIGIAFATLTLIFADINPLSAQWTPLNRSSDNIEVLGHLPLGPHLNVSDMDVEQELSRPYAYVSRMVWGEGGAKGMDIISIEDPKHPELIYESAFIREFRSRARKSAQLNHPSIVPIYDTTGDEEIEAIVMELIEGMPLRVYIDEIGTMSAGKALNVLTQVVDALQHAHQQGIIHGDLNPENIFRTISTSKFSIA